MSLPELRTVLVLSTCHVDEATRDWLNEQGELTATNFRHRGRDGSPSLSMGTHVFGWTVYAHEPNEWHGNEVPEGIKAVMDAVFTYALKHRAFLIHFDADADAVEDLPTFDW